MLAPISWLKDYIDITLKPKELAERLTEVGLGCEKIHETNGDIVLDLEITPNRPDWLSIIGVAREIAAIENKKIRFPKLKTDLKPTGKILPLTIHNDYTSVPRLTGIVIDNVTVKESPQWLKDKLMSIGQRPISNIVDITNFVMFELGNPIHSFDYHKIAGHEFWTKQAKGGEVYESVDAITYHLPKGAIIYQDKEKVFDLVGIKGAKNSGTYNDTKAVFIVVEADDPVLIRKASQALSLRTEASGIFERGVNKGGTVEALQRVTDLVLELAGGNIASELYDFKKEEFKPWKLQLRMDRLAFILGIKIPEKEVLNILDKLNLSPVIVKSETAERSSNGLETTKESIITCIIPTYRNDLQIEEDLIEEVARIYGYNNFPKTLPVGEIPTEEIPYYKNYRLEEKVKNIFVATGFSEIYSYSLVSEEDLESTGINPEHTLRVDNPVSREFEYLRPILKVNLRKALKQNKSYAKEVHLFELGKVYKGKQLNAVQEEYHLAGISNIKSFYEIKGILEKLFADLGIDENPGKYMEALDEGIFFELPYTQLLQKREINTVFQPLPKYPPIIEDLALVVPNKIKIGEIIETIKKQSPIISEVSLLDQYENTKTFHIVYQDKEKNLTTEEVSTIRSKILQTLKEKYKISFKE